MASKRAPMPGRFDNPREDPRFADVFRRHLEELKESGFVDPDEIVAAEPEFGAAILEDLETYIQLVPEGALSTEEATLGTLGDYTLRRRIGRGGMGVVYEAWEHSMDRAVALKVLPSGIAADDKAFQRFCREAKLAGKLSHPNIVPVFGMGIKEDTPHYAMEYIEGETLAQIVSKFKDSEPSLETPFGPRDRQDFFIRLGAAFADVAEGLQHAHSKGVVHRDVKPSNLILDSEGRLRILDFGLAHLEGQESLTLSGDLLGTVLYMSPEQAMAKRVPMDHRTDIYSLGATIYEMLTCEPPFRGKDHHDTLSQIIVRDPRPVRQLNSGTPKDLETIVLQCLRKDPADRYGTAEALAQDLRRLVRGDPIEARPQSGWERLASRIKRQRVKLSVAAAFLLVLFAAAWLDYERREAKFRSRGLEYESAVRDVLTQIYAGHSLRVVEGNLDALFFKSSDRTLARINPQDIRALWKARETHPVEEATRKLAAIAENVRKPDAHYQLAQAYLLLENEKDAKTELGKALETDPDFPPAEILELQLAGFDPKDAEFQAIWRKYEPAGDWKTAWVEAHKSKLQQDWRRAVEAYGELIALGQSRQEPYIGAAIEARIGRGMAYLALKEYDWATGDFWQALASAPGFIEAELLLGKTYYLSDRTEFAEMVFGKLYDRAVGPGKRNEAALWIAGFYYSVQDYQKGLDWAGELGEEVRVKDRLVAYFLYRLGNTAKAIEAGREAILNNERDPVAHLVLASALRDDFHASSGPERLWKVPEFLRVSRRAAELDPKSLQARNVLALAEAASNDAVYYFLEELLKSTRREHPGTWGVLLMAIEFAFDRGEGAPEGFFDGVEMIDVGLDGQVCCQTVSSDELTLYFSRFVGSPRNNPDIYVMTRERRDVPFVGPARPLSELNTQHEDWVGAGSLSADGSEIYFSSTRPGGFGELQDLWVARLNEPGNPWAGFHRIENLGSGVNTEAWESSPNISRDGKRLYFRSGKHLFMVRREKHEEPFGNRVLLSSRLGGQRVFSPSISADELTLFWGDTSTDIWLGGQGSADVWRASRAKIFNELGQPVSFDNVVNLGPPINTPSYDSIPSLTADWPEPGSGLYFTRNGIQRATWHPDCNGNHVDDLEEIEAGDVEDADQDGVPDECGR